MGVGVRKAAGEGEAELAMLFKEGHIDAVMSDDGDSFMFGAETVMRNPSTRNEELKSEATALNSNESIKLRKEKSDLALAIYSLRTSSLDQNDIIAIAAIAGSDYSDGIKGVGVTLAGRLVRAGVGTSLAVAFSNGRRGGEDVMSAELADWRETVAKLLENGNPKAARKLRASTSIPDANVLGYLFEPKVNVLRPTSPLDFDLPISLPDIINYANMAFHWPGWEIEIHVVKQVYPLLLINALRSQITNIPSTIPPPRLLLPLTKCGTRVGTPRPPSIEATFDMTKTKTSLTSALPLPRNDQHYRERSAEHYIDGKLQDHQKLKDVKPDRLMLWLPVNLLRKAFPAEVAIWESSSGTGRSKAKKEKVAKEVGKGKGRAKRDASTSDVDEPPPPKRTSSAPKPKPKPKSEPQGGPDDPIVIPGTDDEDDIAGARRAEPNFVDDSDDDDNLLPNTLQYNKGLPPPTKAPKATTSSSNPLRPIQSKAEILTIDSSPPMKKARREPAKVVGGGTAKRVVIEINE
ncbi:hypothetical protein RQP46_007189 [Phenoliferia psychrophenolica]